MSRTSFKNQPLYLGDLIVQKYFSDLQQKNHGKVTGLTLQLLRRRQASLAEPRRLPTNFTGELRREKPPALGLLQETQNNLRSRGHVTISGHTAVNDTDLSELTNILYYCQYKSDFCNKTCHQNTRGAIANTVRKETTQKTNSSDSKNSLL